MAGILEFHLEYTNGETSWNPITVVKDEDPHATANYIIGSALGPVSNRIHERWTHTFLKSLKRTLRRLRRCEFDGFDATTYNPFPGKKRSSRRYQSDNKIKSGHIKATAPTYKRTFNFCFKVPKNWKDILRLDGAAGNTLWQDAV
jgi:hypothetical protein